MTPREAFVTLIREAEKTAKKSPKHCRSLQTTKKLHAMLIGADFIRDMSGSWPADEMIWNTDPEECTKLAALMKEEGLV